MIPEKKFSVRAAREIFMPALLSMLVLLAAWGCRHLAGRQADLARPTGSELFRAKCSGCHEPELALNNYRPAEVWLATINRMKTVHHADLSQEEIGLLVDYHVERQRQEAAIFEEKCQKCHPGKVFLEQSLSRDQAAAIIRRMQQKAGNTIEDKDIEIIIRYHARAQQDALQASLSAAFDQVLADQPDMKRGLGLFVEKCSACHNPAKALTVIKDPEVWAKTVKRMQDYSKGAITDREAKEIADLHVARQQEETRTFQETCTACHDDERINSRSMSEEQWLATIKRMQEKAPELITDEKKNLLAAYLHRRELAMARIFYGKCRLCHPPNAEKSLPSGSTREMDGLIAVANNEFGRSLQVIDVNNLLSVHLRREKRVMQLYEGNCATCHVEGLPGREGSDQKNGQERTRAEWVSFIAALQGVKLSKEIHDSINSQIDFHQSRH